MDKKQAKQNGQKAAKNKYYLQMVNQLRRNGFNLNLKREIVAAKTNVKHFFLFNSSSRKYMVQTDPDTI